MPAQIFKEERNEVMRSEEDPGLLAVLAVLLIMAIALVAFSVTMAKAGENGPQCVIVKGKVTCCWTTSAGTVCQ